MTDQTPTVEAMEAGLSGGGAPDMSGTSRARAHNPVTFPRSAVDRMLAAAGFDLSQLPPHVAAVARDLTDGRTESQLDTPGRPTCGSCDHWKAPVDNFAFDGSPMSGQCRFNPPLATGGLYGPEQTVWPTTDAADWCGQHSALAIVITGEPDHRVLEGIMGDTRAILRGEEPVRPVPIEPEGTLYDAHLADASEPHWHVLQNVAQRLGAHRSALRPGRWDVPSFGKLGITGAEVVALGRAAVDEGEPVT